MKRRLLALAVLPLFAGCQHAVPASTTPTPATTTATTPSTPTPTASQLRPSASASTPTAPASRSIGSPSASGTAVSDQDLAMVAGAVGFIERYWSVVDDMRNAGGTPETTAQLATVATGDALQYWLDAAKSWSENGVYSDGRYVVVYADQKSMAVGGGKGTATYQYCIDASRAEFKNRDPQGPVPSKRPERYRTGLATITWVDGGWKYTAAQEKPSNSC